MGRPRYQVNSISPGYTATPMNLRPEVAEQVAQFEADTPLGRMATVDELVGPAIFLLSDAASFCTGSICLSMAVSPAGEALSSRRQDHEEQTEMMHAPPTLLPGQSARVMIGYLDGRPPTDVFVSHDILLEAPNWTMDGSWLIMNGNGRLWRLSVVADGTDLEEIPINDVPALNNDHVLHPDGEHIFVSANDWHIYRASLAGGPHSESPKMITLVACTSCTA
jgi:hypothetical protein